VADPAAEDLNVLYDASLEFGEGADGQAVLVEDVSRDASGSSPRSYRAMSFPNELV
jgi:hypothetical protein